MSCGGEVHVTSLKVATREQRGSGTRQRVPTEVEVPSKRQSSYVLMKTSSSYLHSSMTS